MTAGPASAVLAAIAHAVAGSTDDPAVAVGAVTLHAHQRDAVRRARAALEGDGGVLLADDPGLGKTYVALALARDHPPATVVAPAALRAMWRGAAAIAATEIRFVSTEALSRRDPTPSEAPSGPGTLVIVDEAHHFGNPGTARYSRLARLVAFRRVLLLSATAVRNRRAELAALLALFMGPRAYALDDGALARRIVRRTGDASLRPAIDGPHWHRVRALPGVRRAIETLPPPLPPIDGRDATALLVMSLARCWASSVAALDAALRRRLQRGAALGALLDEGRMPTRDELRAWVVGDDAVQLAFPMLATHHAPAAESLRGILDAHLAAVATLRARLRAHVIRDARARARLLTDLREGNPTSRIVAFTSHAATAEALYRELRRTGGVALLTGRGARTASGARPRSDVIDALRLDARPAHTARDDISLVITTDVLSEGVNLQGASVIVHLDVPWTPAGLDQRVGRAARMGSPHATVHVHGFAPSACADRLMSLGRRLARKRAERTAADRAPRDAERLRAIVQAWRNGDAATDAAAGPLVATVRGERAGFIAVLDACGSRYVACGAPGRSRRWTVSDTPAQLCVVAGAVCAGNAAPDATLEAAARSALERWLRQRRARDAAGGTADASRARRAVLARLDAAVDAAAAHSRPLLARRTARLRALVGRAVSAGAERALDRLARSAADPDSWLIACERELDGASARATERAHDAHDAPVVRALLLLRPDP